MINVVFYEENKNLIGFEISGHSGYAEIGSDIICASVSSAAYMVANTITEILRINTADIAVADAYFKFVLNSDDAKVAKAHLDGFLLHMKTLANDYNEYIICKKKKIK